MRSGMAWRDGWFRDARYGMWALAIGVRPGAEWNLEVHVAGWFFNLFRRYAVR